MKLSNKTKNQHYISQAEQRLNSIDRTLTKDQQRIFEFDVTRKGEETSLGTPRRVRIRKNLSFSDLFSFSQDDLGLRENLEDLFQRYESEVSSLSLEVVNSAENRRVKPTALRNLFKCKFLNFLRNPFSVVKVLNTVGPISAVQFTDPNIESIFNRVRDGSEVHRQVACSKFGMTEKLYNRWLRSLFVLLYPVTGKSCVFDQAIDQLFAQSIVGVRINCYDHHSQPEQVCILSDRGFNVRMQTDDQFMIEFNLSSKAFVTYVFITPHFPPGISLERGSSIIPKPKVFYDTNDIEALCHFNTLSAFQCASKIYAAHHSPPIE